MSTLVLLQFKNYYNRNVKRYSTLQEYYDNSNNVLVVDEYDFNPADGVDTKVTIGGETYDFKDSNYLLVCDGNDIVSRWYIMDADRQRWGQYKLNLHRDLMADFWDNIKDAPMYVEKATLSDNNPLIFNDEGFSVNKIKSDESYIKDKTDVAWLVGYVARKAFTAEVTGTIHIKAETTPDIIINDEISSLGFTDGQKIYHRRETFAIIKYNKTTTYQGATINVAGACRLSGDSFVIQGTGGLSNFDTNATFPADKESAFINALNNIDISTLKRVNNSYTLYTINETKYNNVEQYFGKVIQATNGLYRIDYNDRNFQENQRVTANISGQGNYSKTVISNAISSVGGTPETSVATIFNNLTERTISITQVQNAIYDITIPTPENRYNLKDAPYDMFCIPCPIDKSEVTIKSTGSSAFNPITLTKIKAIQFAQGIAVGLGSFIYDLQLLPFCPISTTVEDKVIDVKADSNLRRTFITKTVEGEAINEGVILWALASQGSLEKNEVYVNGFTPFALTVGNTKISSQCDKYRICAGSYASSFELNAAKNKGVSGLRVDYTYIPYNPYIHVSPIFDGLYGGNYEDCRGLVDQCDKSISYLSDAWQQYQINNKTYLNSFDREVENMEVNRQYQRIGQIASGTVGAISTGVNAGSLAGATAGVVSGVSSAMGASADLYISEKLYQESVDYAKDKFRYSLENIKALPQSIAKMTSYSKNNKVFPLIEYYTCTNEEKDALANKIRYEGMTVGAVGTISEFLNNSWSYGNIQDKGFIRGKFMVLPIDDDFHLASSIEKEMEKGVYTKWE